MLLQLAHVLVLWLLPHPILASNYIQLIAQLLAVVVCLQQRAFIDSPLARRCWLAVASSFGIWSLAQCFFIFFLYFPKHGQGTIRPDDVLWVLFGLPLLLAANSTHENADRIGWLDRLQAMLFFAVIYLLIFLPSIRMNVDESFLIQDLALLLCCLLRLPSAASERERRFFVRVSIFLVIYAPCTIAGDILHKHGWRPGSFVDLVWTLPTTVYTILVLLDAISFQEVDAPSRLLVAVRNVQGLSVAALAFLSLTVSALLATHLPLLGGALLAFSFVLFAMRTNARERAWHKANERLENTVLQDALTGLGNRILLRQCLRELLSAPSTKESAVLIFADLDHFKSINDSFGHALGDCLLIEVGRRLRAASPINSIICRIGGDEFVVLCTAADSMHAKASGEMLLETLHLPFQLGGHVIHCSASIGIVLAAGECADDLLRTADHAMYRAKQLGKNRVQLFDAPLLAQLNLRWQMEADLRACVDQNNIDVVFQPILRVVDGEIVGFEALARWLHPTTGPVMPIEFIPLAEETGLILPLGAQVLEKACQQIVKWNRAWGKRFSVSVNVSPRQFADAGLLAMILSTLDRTGLDPSLLRLEITESVLLVHEKTVKLVLDKARAHGISISLDDFGTGYSSLSFLLNLPVDEVKVDRSFVSNLHLDPQRRELVRTVIQLGHSLGKSVVAEGVETEQEFRELSGMGCPCVQGWLISRPMLAEAMEAKMSSIIAGSCAYLGKDLPV